jgi:hypothetical protein
MNRKQRRAVAHNSHREAIPICYLLYCPTARMYLVDADAETTTLKFGEEERAAAMPTREDALELAKDVLTASGLRLAIQPRYLPFYH